MVTRTPVSLTRNFLVPSSLATGKNYVLQCQGDYYNLGSRRDSFYDTFYVTSSSGGGSSSGAGSGTGSEGPGGINTITGGAIADDGTENPWFNGAKISQVIKTLATKLKPILAFTLVLFLVVAAILFFISSFTKLKSNSEKGSPKNKKQKQNMRNSFQRYKDLMNLNPND
jgi:hypothetical protein